MVKSPLEKIEAFKKKDKENGKCSICGGSANTVLMQHLSFVCSRCSGILREFGLAVKGITMTNWTAADADKICGGGNAKEKQEMQAKWDGVELAVNRDSDDAAVRKFIQAKYIDKKWQGKGGGGGGHISSSSRHHGGDKHHHHQHSSGGSQEHMAKQLSSMIGELSQAQAAELIAKHGSVEAAIEEYYNAPPSSSPAKASSSRHKEKKHHKRSSSKEHKHGQDHGHNNGGGFGSFGGGGGGSGNWMMPPPEPPAAMGEAPPDKVHSMAGMVGLMARGEIPSAFSSVPGQPHMQQGMQQADAHQQFGTAHPGAGQSQNWGMPQPGQFNSAPAASPSWQGQQWQQQQQPPGGGPFGQPPASPLGANPGNPFSSGSFNQPQQGCGQQQMSSHQQQIEQQKQQLLQKLMEKKKQLEEQMQQLQKQKMQQQQMQQPMQLGMQQHMPGMHQGQMPPMSTMSPAMPMSPSGMQMGQMQQPMQNGAQPFGCMGGCQSPAGCGWGGGSPQGQMYNSFSMNGSGFM
eukprot:TRINITY_DN4574_c0_g1_i1.p1 TRINITY_DN4574_c0_g1~~TRINITY_DN4574_c0_g1_i1.p1  ORF type:complete len:516 (+),score=169.67 TRINITY_DN4574_c0_g1_i1:178-1725(+)